MKFKIKFLYILFSILIAFYGCTPEKSIGPTEEEGEVQELTIFFVNDQHGQLNNFAKIKHIVDQERTVTNVLLMSAGDIFSGNPIVDQYSEKGYPIIDVMNKVGFDISVIGNHEFDYGVDILEDRINQASFDWVCANVNTGGSSLSQPDPFKTIELNDITVTVLGLVETNGKPDDIIPSTHPWRVKDLTFERYTDNVIQYQNLKTEEDADLLIALTHLGRTSDMNLANEYPYFDVIIGGHSNDLLTEEVNGTLVFMAGAYLSHLGKVELKIRGKDIVEHSSTLINLDTYDEIDEELMSVIEEYNEAPEFTEVVGYTSTYLDRNELGCFYTTGLMEYLDVDCSFQNGGGIRADIAAGDITVLDIYRMDPFNNGSVVFTMTVAEIRNFFEETGARMHVSGITLERSQSTVDVIDEFGNRLEDSEVLTIGINDYIPAVYDDYFNYSGADIKELTTAEVLIEYLKGQESNLDYENCNQFFTN